MEEKNKKLQELDTQIEDSENFLSYIKLPTIALRGKMMFPHTTGGFDIGRVLSLNAVAKATEEGLLLFISQQKKLDKENITVKDLNKIGVVVKVLSLNKAANDSVRVSVQALCRARIVHSQIEDNCIYSDLVELPSKRENDVAEEAYFRLIQEEFSSYLQIDPRSPKEALASLQQVTDPEQFMYRAASFMQLSEKVKQQLLNEPVLIEQLKLFLTTISAEKDILKIEKKIQATVRKNIDKNQKEFYLREQIRAIHAELGDDEEEKETLKKAILKKKMPKEVEAKVLKELAKLDKIMPSSPEYANIYFYIEWILDLPWNELTRDTKDIQKAKDVLNADHYGLDKVKTRIIEYLSVMQLCQNNHAPILCFVGPPGVGKTSIAKSIATALGRKFVRLSMGGVKDETEIRGHRRTYVGSLPGRLIYAMKQAEVMNPVILLDEVDKLSSDMRGDPASALLEVLDPEQNNSFRDRFLEVPYDLSKVLFITTANDADMIPEPLLDRMELIELGSYTREEKKEIAKRYLVPKKIEENGLPSGLVEFTEDGILTIIEGYTLEAGVRSLERQIGSICRKIAVKYLEDKNLPNQIVNAALVEELLGVKRFHEDKQFAEESEVGLATGLAWTSVGGTTLAIEVRIMKGKGDILLTGKLGDVMKESAQTAISYIRANAEKYNLSSEEFNEKDIHIHIPEGATPKDGPSAGITLATAILSAFTNKPVRKDIAMTGEITLRGKVLPIGGLKEKTLASHRIGIKNIIISHENQKDLEDIPKNIREEMHFIIVKSIDEVFANAIEGL